MKTELSVAVLLRNPQGQYFLNKRPDNKKMYPGLWAGIGGHVEIPESPIDAVRREFNEETGLDLYGEPGFMRSYSVEDGVGIRIEFPFESNRHIPKLIVNYEGVFAWMFPYEIEGPESITGLYADLMFFESQRK